MSLIKKDEKLKTKKKRKIEKKESPQSQWENKEHSISQSISMLAALCLELFQNEDST